MLDYYPFDHLAMARNRRPSVVSRLFELSEDVDEPVQSYLLRKGTILAHTNPHKNLDDFEKETISILQGSTVELLLES